MMRKKFCIAVKLHGLVIQLHFCIAMQWKQQADQVFGIKVPKGKEKCYSNAEMETIAFLNGMLNATQMAKVLFMFIKGSKQPDHSWGEYWQLGAGVESLRYMTSLPL